MGRYIPRMRSRLIDIYYRRMQRRDTSGPVFVALGDHIAELEGLYHVELTKPAERPVRMKPVTEAPEPPETVEDKEADAAYAEYLKQQYGGEHAIQGQEQATVLSTGVQDDSTRQQT
jgi:hypothetical protein